MNIALIICVVGGAVYAICDRRKPLEEIAELGRLAFLAGLLALLLK